MEFFLNAIVAVAVTAPTTPGSSDAPSGDAGVSCLDEAHRKESCTATSSLTMCSCEIEGQQDFVKVLDFGVAKLREGGDDGATLTQHGVLFGTPKYMSPEQCRSQIVDAAPISMQSGS